MYLNRDYRPRRKNRSLWRFWPLYLLIAIAVILYEQRPTWLIRPQFQPTAIPTLGAVAFLADAQSALEAGRYSDGIAALDRVVQLEPQNADALVELSELNLLFQNVPTALEYARQAYANKSAARAKIAAHRALRPWCRWRRAYPAEYRPGQDCGSLPGNPASD